MTKTNKTTKRSKPLKETADLGTVDLIKLHSTIYRSIPDAVIVTSPTRRVVSWNKGAEDVSGYSEKQMLGKDPNAFLKARYLHGATPEAIRQSLFTIGSWKGEALYMVRGGKVVHALLTISAIIGDEGGYLGAVTIARDISELSLAKHELEKINERLSLAQDTGKVGIFEYNFKTGETWRNAEQTRLFGIAGHPRRKQKDMLKDFVHPEDRERTMAMLAETIKAKKAEFELEYRVVHPDKTVHWLKSISRVIYDAAGKPDRYIGINLDIDERKQVEKDLNFKIERSEERRVGKECRSRWSPYH